MLQRKQPCSFIAFAVGIALFLFIFCTLLNYSVFACIEHVHGAAGAFGVFVGAFIYIAGFVLCTWSFVRGCVVDAGPVRPWLRREIVEGHVIGILRRWARGLPPGPPPPPPPATGEAAATAATATSSAATTTSAAPRGATAVPPLASPEAKIKFVSRAAQLREVLAEASSEAKIKANDAMSESIRAREAADAVEMAELKRQQEEEDEEEEDAAHEGADGNETAELDANGDLVTKQKNYIHALLKRKKKKKPSNGEKKGEGDVGGDDDRVDSNENGEEAEEGEESSHWQPAYINEADNPIRMAERRERKMRRGLTLRSVAQVARDALDVIERPDAATTAASTNSPAHPTTTTTTVVGVTPPESDAKLEQMKVLLHGVTYCPQCEVYQFANTHHCKYCDRCVFQQSHHCVVLGQCAAYDNVKYVLLCEIYTSLWCGAGAVLTAVSLLHNWSFIARAATEEFNAAYYVAFVLSSTYAATFTALSIQNLIAIVRGESLRRAMRRQERLNRAIAEREVLDGNAYAPLDAREEDADDFLSHRVADATLDNFKNAVGEDQHVLMWLLPVAPQRRPAELERRQFMEELDKIVDVQLHAIANVEDAEEQMIGTDLNVNVNEPCTTHTRSNANASGNGNGNGNEHPLHGRRRPSALEDEDVIIITVPPPPADDNV